MAAPTALATAASAGRMTSLTPGTEPGRMNAPPPTAMSGRSALPSAIRSTASITISSASRTARLSRSEAATGRVPTVPRPAATAASVMVGVGPPKASASSVMR